VCRAKTIAGFYRRASEARKFSEDSNNPVKKREFKEIERRWLQIARECKCPSDEKAQKPSRRGPHRPRRMR
jgi:hypothetical protein